jgi:hypothetical protein
MLIPVYPCKEPLEIVLYPKTRNNTRRTSRAVNVILSAEGWLTALPLADQKGLSEMVHSPNPESF